MGLHSVLKELHRIHRQLSDLREQSARCPKQIAASEGVVKKLEAEAAKAKEAYKQAKLSCDEKNLQLKQRESKILDLRGKLHQAESNQVYQVLKDQIAADEQANSVLSDEILEALESLDTLQAAIGVSAANLAKGKEDHQATLAKVAARQAELEAEIARVTANLEQEEKQLDEDLLPEYLRMTRAKGEDSLASVEGENCGGCFQTLTVQTMNALYMDKLFFCKSCGRLLYLAEERKRS